MSDHADSALAGGGELGAVLRAHDWDNSPLGPPSTWPQSLKTAVRIMLTSRQPIWIGWGEQLTYLYNDAYRSIIGGKHPWALGRATSEVWSEIWSDIGPMLDTAMAGVEGTYVEEQLLIMERNGYSEETYYTFSYSPIPDDGGGVGGIICANTDDTERVIGQRQLALLRDLAAKTNDARTLADACSKAAAALSSDPKDVTFAAIYLSDQTGECLERVGVAAISPDHNALPKTITSADLSPISAVVRQRQTMVLDQLDGVWRDLPTDAWRQPSSKVAILYIPAAGDTGRDGALVVGLNPFRLFDGAYSSFLDLAAGQLASAVANAQAYDAERRRAEALSELDRAKTAFFSNASHEFRTPLTLMLGPIEDLLRDAQGAHGEARASQQTLGLIHRNGLRLLRLVNSLLDFSRIEAGRARAQFEPVDLALLTRELSSSFESAMRRAGLDYHVDCNELDQPVYVDRDLWEKIVLNLISNAFKYTLAGRVTVTLGADADGVVLRVKDTGVGIPAEELPRVFERFHRIEGQRGRTLEGTGIGLALVQELVRLHGGRTDVESSLGTGSTFSVWLPFGPYHLPEDMIGRGDARSDTNIAAAAFVEEALRWLPDTDVPASGLSADYTAGLSSCAGARILLAEDNADMRAYISRILTTAGYEVEGARDGYEALERAQTQKPDLVLSDVMMPRLDGFGLLKALRTSEMSTLPVIMLSARAGEDAQVEGRSAGADDYMEKPFSARELLSRVESAIKLARLRDETATALQRSERQLRHANAALAQANGLLADESSRLKDLFQQAPSLAAVLRGPDHRFELANAQYMKVVGDRDILGKTVRDALPELEGQGFYELLDQVYASGEPFIGEAVPALLHSGPNAELEQHFINFVYQPIRNTVGEVVGIFVDGYDVTAAKRTQSLEAAQSRALQLVLSTGSVHDALSTLVETIEAQGEGMKGSVLLFDPAAGILRHGAAPNLPDAYNAAIDGIAIGPAVGSCGTAAFKQERVIVDNIATDPLWRDFCDLALSFDLRACWSTPIFASDGDLLGTFAMYYSQPRQPKAADLELVEVAARSAALIIERKRDEERQLLLVNELNHRVKNSLATVQAIAQQTFREGVPSDTAMRAFQQRLSALAQSHDVLTREAWSGADLDEVVKGAVAPVSGGRVTVEGPNVRLNAKQALALSMALHELATNAAKYGALSNAEGRCIVSWSFASADRALDLLWREQGGPMVAAPTRKGFGSRLIERGLAGELRAEVALTYPPEGVTCAIKAKLEA